MSNHLYINGRTAREGDHVILDHEDGHKSGVLHSLNHDAGEHEDNAVVAILVPGGVVHRAVDTDIEVLHAEDCFHAAHNLVSSFFLTGGKQGPLQRYN